MADFSKKYGEYLDEFNSYLNKFCSQLKLQPQILDESLKYSLMLGGKRVRPVLALATADLLGLAHEEILDFALAIELIHTYSLIHDDLPAMDNDDFRRGKPTNHKVFGEGNAVLAGDGLLNTAYSTLIKACYKGKNYVSAAEFICACAGVEGMIAGQSADLLHENDISVNESVLNFIYENKTSKLIMAPVVSASILCGGKYFSELKWYARTLGYLFQLTDDILDVEGSFSDLGKSVGKDKTEGKYTAVRLFGLEESKLRADMTCESCKKYLEGIKGDFSFLADFADYVKSRKK